MTDPLDPQPPVAVTLIGTAADAPLSGTVAVTPGTQPNLLVTLISPAVAILVRFLHAYLTTLVGLVAAGMTTDAIPAASFTALVWKCATLSLAGAGLGLLRDCVTIFGRLESKYPLATGNV